MGGDNVKVDLVEVRCKEMVWIEVVQDLAHVTVCCERGDESAHSTLCALLNPFNAKLNPICHLLALLGAHHIFHVSGLRVKAWPGERAWQAIRDSLQRPYYLSRVDHVRKIRDSKQREDSGKYSFVNRTIKNWNQLPAETLGTFPCKPKSFRSRVRKSIRNWVKWKE